ncbi:MAG: YraN family protein [Acidimicrobiales bacterium]|nr:YraN family protein [Acidimicrobiales bacterium]
MTPGAGSSRRDLGRRGEALAARWYADHGYEVLDRNWRCRDGEIDLVVRRNGTLVFCEVKTRTSRSFGSGAEAVSAAKQRRVRRLAVRWLAEGRAGRTGALELRFDVASVTAGVLEVISDAF